MKTIIVTGDTNRDNTITFKAVLGTAEQGKLFIQECILEEGTTTEQVEENEQKAFFSKRYEGKAEKINVRID